MPMSRDLKYLKILFVSGGRIFPVRSGGQRRSALLIDAFSKHTASVVVFSLTDRKGGPDKGAPGCAPNVTEIVPKNALLTLFSRIGFRLGLPPVWFYACMFMKLPRPLNDLVSTADIVIADFPFTAPILRRASGLKILNTHNLEHMLEISFLRKIFIRPLINCLEKRAARYPAIIVACCEQDARFYRALPKLRAKVLIVPNGLEVQPVAANQEEKLRIRRDKNIPKDILVGLFPASSYGPNKDALAFLKEFAAGHGQELESLGIHLLVVGSVSREAFSCKGLTVLGPVEKIEPFFAAADFLINPIFRGSGTSIKVAEAIAARMPLLTTTIGARGYWLIDGDSAFFFNEENLLERMKELRRRQDEFANISSKAWDTNRHLIDVEESVDALLAACRSAAP